MGVGLRPAKGGKGVNAYEKSKDNLEKHFKEHGKELGYNNIDEYKNTVYDIIKNPDMVYVERTKDEQTWYNFIKDQKVVLLSDDILWIKNILPI